MKILRNISKNVLTKRDVYLIMKSSQKRKQPKSSTDIQMNKVQMIRKDKKKSTEEKVAEYK